ncbi:MAG: NAD(P)/FAD-dependent oxidoreductase [Bacillota bacterium]
MNGIMYDVVVLGAGPAGLAAGYAASRAGSNVLIIEREERAGGILKQCIHDGFGLIRFKQKLTGPEYAERYIRMVNELSVPVLTSTFVTKVKKENNLFNIELVNEKDGVFEINAKSLVLANGCRERTSKQVFIHGSRPSGVYTAGTAQYFVNIMGYLPCKKCVILGSGDIGLIMARRLTLEGTEVLGVYEAKTTPSGLARNIVQCLEDYNIPLYLSHTVTRIVGTDRVEAVEIAKVDDSMRPIPGTQQMVECDGLILSVGLIPENEIAEALGIKMDANTRGPVVDQNFMTSMEGVFSCGNALHVNDLVDYVSESGELAGEYAADYSKGHYERKLIAICGDSKDFLYIVPQYIDINSDNKKAVIYFRSRDVRYDTRVSASFGGVVVHEKKHSVMRPPEMEKIELDLSKLEISADSRLELRMVEG